MKYGYSQCIRVHTPPQCSGFTYERQHCRTVETTAVWSECRKYLVDIFSSSCDQHTTDASVMTSELVCGGGGLPWGVSMCQPLNINLRHIREGACYKNSSSCSKTCGASQSPPPPPCRIVPARGDGTKTKVRYSPIWYHELSTHYCEKQ